MYDDYDDGSEGGTSLGRKLALGIGVVALIALAWFVVKPKLTGNDAADADAPAAQSGGTAETTVPSEGQGSLAGAAPDATGTTGAGRTSTTETPEAPVTTTTEPPTEAPTTVATTAPATPPPTAGPTAPYETLPDGSPAPVIALYGPDKITLQGAVPDQAASDRLASLAVANAKPGQDTVENLLTLNPAVPRNVGVRVIELTSARFPDGSAEILPDHAIELDRVVNIMNALPNITALVIGHADQRGNELANYALSDQRASAVVDYMASKGIAPSRLSSRAVGESDLLTLNNDDAAFQLNKRTEFVFYGLLLP
jgi:outer membrane protein OmpA-like peptidoglycan-associated protein